MSTAIAERRRSTKREESDAPRRAPLSKDRLDCRSATRKSRLPKYRLRYHRAATVKIARLIVAAFPSRLSRYRLVRHSLRREGRADRKEQDKAHSDCS